MMMDKTKKWCSVDWSLPCHHLCGHGPGWVNIIWQINCRCCDSHPWQPVFLFMGVQNILHTLIVAIRFWPWLLSGCCCCSSSWRQQWRRRRKVGGSSSGSDGGGIGRPTTLSTISNAVWSQKHALLAKMTHWIHQGHSFEVAKVHCTGGERQLLWVLHAAALSSGCRWFGCWNSYSIIVVETAAGVVYFWLDVHGGSERLPQNGQSSHTRWRWTAIVNDNNNNHHHPLAYQCGRLIVPYYLISNRMMTLDVSIQGRWYCALFPSYRIVHG